MIDPKVVYVAGPYSSDEPDQVSLNIQRAEEAALALLMKGHYPLIPHPMYNGLEGRLTYEAFMRSCLALVGRCDWFLYLGSSPGADRELEEAHQKGLQVFESVEEVPAVTEAIA